MIYTLIMTEQMPSGSASTIGGQSRVVGVALFGAKETYSYRDGKERTRRALPTSSLNRRFLCGASRATKLPRLGSSRSAGRTDTRPLGASPTTCRSGPRTRTIPGHCRPRGRYCSFETGTARQDLKLSNQPWVVAILPGHHKSQGAGSNRSKVGQDRDQLLGLRVGVIGCVPIRGFFGT